MGNFHRMEITTMDLGKVKRTIEVVPEKTPAHSPAEPSPQPVPVER